MNVFILYWHPEPQSFNGALLDTAVANLLDQGHEVRVSNLHKMRFNPISNRKNFSTVKDPDYFKQQIEEVHATETGGFSKEIENEISNLEWCDLMIWQFPLWWFGLPAMIKGWVDRVFVMGRVYGGGKIYETGVFIGKRALLSVTTGGPEEAYKAGGFNGDINAILRPIQRGMLEFTGFDVLAPNIIYGPAHLTDRQRREHLEQYSLRLKTIGEEQPVGAGIYG